MYILPHEIQKIVARCTDDKVIVTPLSPPYIQVISGKHTNKQKLGAFLTKTCNVSDERVVKRLVEEYKQANVDLASYDIRHTTDYVGIYKHALYAIDSTSESCMTGDTSVRVYGYDNRLSLLTAYFNDTLVLRTLVRSDTMKYVRLYIDHNLIKTPIAKAIVANAGYTEGNLEGITLTCIDNGNSIVCPYLDALNSFDIIDEEYLLITAHGEYSGNTTSGIVEREDRYTCSNCGCTLSEDEIYCEDDDILCEYCYDANYLVYEGKAYAKEDCVTNLSNNELIPIARIDYADIGCTEDGNWYSYDDLVPIDGCTYHKDDCVELAEADTNGNSHSLFWDAVLNKQDTDNLCYGYWHKDQIREVIDTLEYKISTKQIDMFTDYTTETLTIDELNTLTIELNYLKQLLKG